MTSLPVCFLSLIFLAAPPTAPDHEFEAARRLLRDAGIDSDTQGLLRYFRTRAMSEMERTRLARQIVDLGADSFQTREQASRGLTEAGARALPFLRAALRDPDLEIRRRAQACLRQIDEYSDRARTMAAARVLAEHRPAGAVSALLACLPDPSDEDTAPWETFLYALDRIGTNDPALDAALTSREVAARAAAAFVLGHKSPGARPVIRRLLDVSDPVVRLHAAHGLLLGGDREAVITLIALVEEKNSRWRRRAEDLLSRLAGERHPSLPSGEDEATLRLRRAAWSRWWKEQGNRPEFPRLEWQEPYQDLTVVCDCDVENQSRVGRVWACAADGSVRWQVNGVANPADVQLLPGGRVLVAECYGGNKVTERDRTGKVLWEFKLQDSAVNCQRLPGGNTFMASYSEIVEVAPDGKVVYSHRLRERTTCAIKLRNGNILYTASNNQLIEMTTSGKEVRGITVNDLSGWAGVEVLANGNYLVARYSANQVVELDPSGKVVMKWNVTTPAWATRLRNGNTLVCSPNGHFVAEYDNDGKEVWKRASFGRPFRVRRY